MAAARPDVVRIGYIGSYARGDWGVGSDLDLVILVRDSDLPAWERAIQFDATALPVPADVWVFTQDEWTARASPPDRFHQTVEGEAIWLYDRRRPG